MDSNPQKMTDNSALYSIKKPSLKAWLIYILVAIILSTGYTFILFDSADFFLPVEKQFDFMLEEKVWGVIIPNISIILVTPFIWNIVTKNLIKKQIREKIELIVKKENQSNKKFSFSLFESIFGINLKPENQYYLEKNTIHLNLDNPMVVIRKKMISAVSSTLGVTFILASLSNFLAQGILESQSILFLSIMVMQIVPLLISWIVPVNWALNDTALNYINSEGYIYNTGDKMSKGILKKFIGIGGFIMGVNVCYNLAFSKAFSLYTNVLTSLTYFLFFYTLLISGSIILISLLYFLQYHESLVNNIRRKFSEFLPIGQMHVKFETSNELKEKIAKFTPLAEKSPQKRMLKIIFVIILLFLAFLGEFIVLIILGPFRFL